MYSHSFSAEASHALVRFVEEEDQPTCIVPVKRVKDCAGKDLKAGAECKVEWTDRSIYSAHVLAVGKSCTHAAYTLLQLLSIHVHLYM